LVQQVSSRRGLIGSDGRQQPIFTELLAVAVESLNDAVTKHNDHIARIEQHYVFAEVGIGKQTCRNAASLEPPHT
jgi:hypothetical protein